MAAAIPPMAPCARVAHTGAVLLACWWATGCRASDAPVATATSPLRPEAVRGCATATTGCLTIWFKPEKAGCREGVFYVDGVMQGRYPVADHPVPVGTHTIHISSANDCAGHGDRRVRIAPGQDIRLHPRDF